MTMQNRFKEMQKPDSKNKDIFDLDFEMSKEATASFDTKRSDVGLLLKKGSAGTGR